MSTAHTRSRNSSRSFLMGLSFSITMVFALAGFSLYGLNQNLQVAKASEITTTKYLANTNQEVVKNLELVLTQNQLSYTGLYFSDSNSCQQVESTQISMTDEELKLQLIIAAADNCANFGDILPFSGATAISLPPSQALLDNIKVELK